MRIARFALATLAFCVFATFFVAVGNNVGVNGTFDWGTPSLVSSEVSAHSLHCLVLWSFWPWPSLQSIGWR